MNSLADRDDFENSYLLFFNALEVLAASPEKACETLGYYNAALETKHDVESGPYLFDLAACTLTDEHRAAILQLVANLQLIPADVLAFTRIRSESLEKMQYPSWDSVRAEALRLLESLQPITAVNKWYFQQDRSNG